MGVTISNGTKSLELTCSGFFRLRRDIAYSIDNELGKHYETILDGYRMAFDQKQEFFKNFEKKLDSLEEEKGLDSEVLDFLMASDSGGKINFYTAEKILNALKLIKGKGNYGYAAHSIDVNDVIILFAEAVKNNGRGFVEWH